VIVHSKRFEEELAALSKKYQCVEEEIIEAADWFLQRNPRMGFPVSDITSTVTMYMLSMRVPGNPSLVVLVFYTLVYDRNTIVELTYEGIKESTYDVGV
jgi:hypothetical protein